MSIFTQLIEYICIMSNVNVIQRSLFGPLKQRIEEPRRFIQVIFGPRQVGKTTLVRQVIKEYSHAYTYESADAVLPSNNAWISQLWESARLKMKAENSSDFLLVIDEIQKIENWSEIVKQQWDRDTMEGINIKVILLGSSRLLLQRGLNESLAGRFEVMYLGHWSYREMQEAFDWNLSQYIYFGAYPGAAGLVEDEDRWKNYIKNSLIESSISKDILMLTQVNKPALLKRLFELGCLYSGQILSYTKIMGQLQDAGNTTTLANYLTLLSDSGLLGGLEKYSGNVIRKRSSSPKFQVYNNALLNAQGILTYREVVTDAKKWGRLAESAIGAYLINSSISEDFQLFYWREGNNEVDFILEKKGQVVGIEVKTGMEAGNKGMQIFNDKYHPDKILLVGTSGISFEDFLKINPNELF